MLDLLLKAIDRLVELARIRDKRLRARYDDIHKPTFSDLQSVHTDYVLMLTELQQKLDKLRPDCSSDDPAASESLTFLAVRRVQLLPVRDKLATLDHLIFGPDSKSLCKQELDFLRAITDYFATAGIAPRGLTVSSTLLEDLRWALEKSLDLSLLDSPSRGGRPTVQDVQLGCRVAIDEMRTSWQHASRCFYVLRMRAAVSLS